MRGQEGTRVLRRKCNHREAASSKGCFSAFSGKVSAEFMRGIQKANTKAHRMTASVPSNPKGARRLHLDLVRTYTTCVSAFGVLLLLTALDSPSAHAPDALMFVGLVVLAEFTSSVLLAAQMVFSMSTAVTFAMLLLFGPLPAVLGSMAGSIAVTFVTCVKDLRAGRSWSTSLARQALFNMGALGVSVFVAGLVYLALRGITGETEVLSNMLPLALAAISSELLNAALVVHAVALQSGRRSMQVWRDNVSWAMPMNILTMTLGGAGLALAHQTVGILGVAVYSLPIALTVYAFRLYVVKTKAYMKELQRMIIDREQAQAQLKASLAEKEVLLKEIHHRVKNNLQVISSLLNLQSHSAGDRQTIQMFKESRNRIRSMALVHEGLYQSDDLGGIEFSHYVSSLTGYLLRSYGVDTGGVELTIDVDRVHLGIDSAVPCGLIVNELVSNSLKYAFVDGRQGHISIELHSVDNGRYELKVGDNGVGIPEGLDIGHTESLGLRLVSTLVEQIEGTMDLDRNAGTVFTITFGDSGLRKEVQG